MKPVFTKLAEPYGSLKFVRCREKRSLGTICSNGFKLVDFSKVKEAFSSFIISLNNFIYCFIVEKYLDQHKIYLQHKVVVLKTRCFFYRHKIVGVLQTVNISKSLINFVVPIKCKTVIKPNQQLFDPEIKLVVIIADALR